MSGGACRILRGGEMEGQRRRRAAIMADVGQLAGVSHQTVSRVINGSPNVRPETRERVIAAIRELDYRPNSLARALVTGRSKMLGVISFDTTLYGPASTLLGIERAASGRPRRCWGSSVPRTTQTTSSSWPAWKR